MVDISLGSGAMISALVVDDRKIDRDLPFATQIPELVDEIDTAFDHAHAPLRAEI